jgi:hypothetical protein
MERTRQKAEQGGFTVVHELAADWSSTDLFACPDFQFLRRLVKERAVDSVVTLDRDRLQADGLQRLLFLAELQDAGVELLLCQGPPVLSGPEGRIVELALALVKELQVSRAQQGAKDGLKDRATRYGLPTSWHRQFGYDPDPERKRYVPNADYPTVKLIFSMLLAGHSYLNVCRELYRRGILSPKGKPKWIPAVISQMARNAFYAGRYYALRKYAVEPTRRRGVTSGKTSLRQKPLDEATLLSVEIIDPPIALEQQAHILSMADGRHCKSQRNGHRNYLLRGRVSSNEFLAENGAGRIYRARPKSRGEGFYYACPVPGSRLPNINGDGLDSYVKLAVSTMVWTMPRDEIEAALRASDLPTREAIEADLAAVRSRRHAVTGQETKLLLQEVSGYSLEAINGAKASLALQRQYLDEQETLKLAELSSVGKAKTAADVVAELSSYFLETLIDNGVAELAVEEWQRLFDLIDLRVRVLTADEKRRQVEQYMMDTPDLFQVSNEFVEGLVSARNQLDVVIEADVKLPSVMSIVNSAPRP